MEIVEKKSLRLCVTFLEQIAKQTSNVVLEICAEQCNLNDQVKSESFSAFKEYLKYYLARLILPNSISKCNHTSHSLASVDLAGSSGQTWSFQNSGVHLCGVVSLIPWEKYDKSVYILSEFLQCECKTHMFVFGEVIQLLFSWFLLPCVSFSFLHLLCFSAPTWQPLSCCPSTVPRPSALLGIESKRSRCQRRQRSRKRNQGLKAWGKIEPSSPSKLFSFISIFYSSGFTLPCPSFILNRQRKFNYYIPDFWKHATLSAVKEQLNKHSAG